MALKKKKGIGGWKGKYSELLRLIEVGASCFNHYCLANIIVSSSLTQCPQAYEFGLFHPYSFYIIIITWITKVKKTLFIAIHPATYRGGDFLLTSC